MSKKILLFLSLCLALGCVRKLPIEQGNVFSPDVTEKLAPGMSIDEVRHIMGTPILLNTFSENRFDYVYTFKTGYNPMQEKKCILYFQSKRLKTINCTTSTGN